MKRKLGIGVLALLAGMQLVRPAKTNPPERAALEAPEEVRAVLQRSCYDCHSNETRWPWYSHVAPMSWLVTKHVNEGRKEMNFSAPPKRGLPYEDICNVLETSDMPMQSYLYLHRDAKVSSKEADAVCGWARSQ